MGRRVPKEAADSAPPTEDLELWAAARQAARDRPVGLESLRKAALERGTRLHYAGIEDLRELYADQMKEWDWDGPEDGGE